MCTCTHLPLQRPQTPQEAVGAGGLILFHTAAARVHDHGGWVEGLAALHHVCIYIYICVPYIYIYVCVCVLHPLSCRLVAHIPSPSVLALGFRGAGG